MVPRPLLTVLRLPHDSVASCSCLGLATIVLNMFKTIVEFSDVCRLPKMLQDDPRLIKITPRTFPGFTKTD